MSQFVDITNVATCEMEIGSGHRDNAVKSNNTPNVDGPIAVRTRRSCSGERTSPGSPNILKKRRRSSIKRKSLAETIKSVAGSISDSVRGSSPARDDALGNEIVQTSLHSRALSTDAPSSSTHPQSPCTSRNILETVTENDLLQYTEDDKFVLRHCSILQTEAAKWTQLLQKHRDAEATADKFPQSNESPEHRKCVESTLDYDQVASRIKNIDRRLIKAVKMTSRAVKIMQTVIDHKNTGNLAHCDQVNDDTQVHDPRDLLEKIARLDSMSNSVGNGAVS